MTANSESKHIVCPACDAVNRVPDERLGAGQCGRCGKPLFPGATITLTDTNFAQQIGRNDLPVLVDFWATWCGPCQTMAPVLEQLAAKRSSRLRVGKLETETAPNTAARFGIRSIPTLVLFRGGREVARVSGAMPLASLEQWLTQQGVV